MGSKSDIQWTEATWNPFHGCKKVSEGCKYCYMYRDKERYGQDPTTVLKSKTQFSAPLRWKEPKLIFTCSWSDWFIEDADAWRAELWAIIKATPQHTYQILTKRPERIAQCLPDDWGAGYKNVWLGVSVENQKVGYERIKILVNTPAQVRFLSIEPIIDKINLFQMVAPNHYNYMEDIHWIIVGGESGHDTGKYRYRPAEVEWFQNIIAAAGWHKIPVFVKQFGTFLSKKMGMKDRHGGDYEEFPEWAKVRQFPEME